jgi:hypothetical protein
VWSAGDCSRCLPSGLARTCRNHATTGSSADIKTLRAARSSAPPHPQQVFARAVEIAAAMLNLDTSRFQFPASSLQKVHRHRSLRCVASLPNMAGVNHRAQFGEEAAKRSRETRTVRLGLRLATPRPEMPYPSIPLSYRHYGRVEHHASRRKQRTAAPSTRHKICRGEFAW